MDAVPPDIVEHTVLGPTTTPDAVRAAVTTAADGGMAACVPPCYVDIACETAPAVETVTVVGFPHGHHRPPVKRAEAEQAVHDGADAVDVVANIGRLQAGETGAVEDELTGVVETVDVPVRVIVEAGLLSEAEKRCIGGCAVAAGAAMLKTSTGYAGGPATVADVALLAEYLPVKASGGIDTPEQARAMLDAGAERIGTSSGPAVCDTDSYQSR
jgi:deoxyribose-phosphate aldolase